LRRQVMRRNISVVRRELVALQAEGANPQLAPHVNLAVRVEHRAAGRLAHYGLVHHWRKLGTLFKRRVYRRNGNHTASRFNARVGKHIP
ncbi:hypothetical protein BX661DRAFT_179710, partial [Kickxella alabastrina]|uniref:uncharacterized protein n=1 Tax=Kickxella alabastrina TaxID=61397 RepID=UPI00221E4C6A